MEPNLLARMHQLRRRWRAVRAVRQGLRWAAWGGWVAVGLALVMKLFDRPLDELVGVLWAPLLFGLGGVVRELLSELPLLSVALETDRVARLKERLSTAVEWLLAARPATAVTQFMVNDAAEHAQAVQPARVFPWRLRRPLANLVLPLLLAGLVLGSPTWGLWEKGPAPEEVRAVQASANRIDELARRIAAARPATPPTRPLAPRLEALARQLREKGLDRQEAAARIQSLARQLAQERAAAGRSQGQAAPSAAAQASADKLGELARQLAQGMPSEQARQKLEALRQQLDPKSEAARRAAEAAQALQEGEPGQAAQKLTQASESARSEEGQNGQGQDLAGEVGEELSQEGEGLDPGSTRPGSEGQAGQGVAANPSQGQQGKGKGKGPADFGVGTTNQEEQPGEDRKPQARLVRQSDKTSDWQEAYQKLYGAQRDHFDSATTRVRGQKQRGRVLRSQGEVVGAPTAGGDSLLRAEEVFLNSKQSAEQAVAQGSIPAEYREAVRGYFDGIDPRHGP